jgi:hypothetical protein
MKILKVMSCFLLLGVCCGCAGLLDAPKNVVGISVRDMEDRRSGSIYQSYECSVMECFDAVVDIAVLNKYNVFLKDEAKGVIVLMDIPGAVDTTEVGVFFTALETSKGVKVEVSSRSAPAKRTAAVLLFAELAQKFTKI